MISDPVPGLTVSPPASIPTRPVWIGRRSRR
jgi:hypothetical protein